MTISLVCAALLLSGGQVSDKAVAILPPVPVKGADPWLGMAVADSLEVRLLGHQRQDRKTKATLFPLSVFSWRQSLSAARAEGIDTSRPLSAAQAQALAGQLGARYVFVGSYAVKQKKKKVKVLFKWRLVDVQSKKKAKVHRVKTSITSFAAKTERLASDLLEALGEKSAKAKKGKKKKKKKKVESRDSLAKTPLTAISAYAKGIAILGGQSLDPWARVVLPGKEILKAHILFESATEAAPKLRRAWIGRAIASAMLGEVAAAAKELAGAEAEKHASDPLTALGLYYVHVRKGEHDAALKALATATAAQPGFLAGLGYLGKSYFRAGRPAKALEVFDRYRARVPDSPWVRLMQARAFSFLDSHDNAISEARGVYEAFPSSVMVATNYTARLTQAGKYREAQEVLERALAQHRAHPALLTRLSYVELKIGSVAAALELAQKAVAELEKGRGETIAGYAYANLGHALALSGKKQEAKAAFERAAALGISIDDRYLLDQDARVKKVVGETALAKDAPPPPPPPPPPLPAAEKEELTEDDELARAAEAEEAAADDDEDDDDEEEDEDWDEEDDWEDDEDWEE